MSGFGKPVSAMPGYIVFSRRKILFLPYPLKLLSKHTRKRVAFYRQPALKTRVIALRSGTICELICYWREVCLNKFTLVLSAAETWAKL